MTETKDLMDKDGNRKQRKRTQFTGHQLQVLENLFSANPYPHSSILDDTSASIQLSDHVVRVSEHSYILHVNTFF